VSSILKANQLVHFCPNTPKIEHFDRSTICSRVFSVTFCPAISKLCSVAGLIPIFRENC
jgi:hypothetical protein